MTAHASPGKITLVGLGPGNLADLTGRARAALAEADTVIGYVTYIRQIKDLLEGKTVIKRAMTEELDLPVEYRDLLAMGMRMKAEIDMAPAGADAGAVMTLFDRELRRYANDHQSADGRSVKRAFNCSPRLGRYGR